MNIVYGVFNKKYIQRSILAFLLQPSSLVKNVRQLTLFSFCFERVNYPRWNKKET